MNSYPMAFGILGLGISLAVLLWSRPRLCRHRQVRRFRRELVHVDMVSRWWSQTLRYQEPSDEVPTPLPELRRPRRGQRGDGDVGEGDALV